MTERNLVRCLHEAEKGNSTALRYWLSTTPDAEVTRRLRSIAKRACQSQCWFWLAPFSAAFYLFVFWVNLGQHKPVVVLLSLAAMVCLHIGALSSGIDKWKVRTGRCAVLFLAERGDEEMLAVLITYYLRYFKGRDDWAAKIENALVDLLDKRLCDTLLGPEPPELYKLVQTVAAKRPLHKASHDFSNGKADATAAAIRLLAKLGGETNRGLLISISRQRAPDNARFPSCRFVHDCAVQCLTKPVGPPVIAGATVDSSLVPSYMHSTISSGAGGTGRSFPRETTSLLLPSQQGSESA